MVTFYTNIMSESYLEIISLSNCTILMSISGTITTLKDRGSQLLELLCATVDLNYVSHLLHG